MYTTLLKSIVAFRLCYCCELLLSDRAIGFRTFQIVLLVSDHAIVVAIGIRSCAIGIRSCAIGFRSCYCCGLLVSDHVLLVSEHAIVVDYWYQIMCYWFQNMLLLWTIGFRFRMLFS